MTGPEHYRLAEQLSAQALEKGPTVPVQQQIALAAMAQVHATLALAAATANQDARSCGDWSTGPLASPPNPHAWQAKSPALGWEDVL